MTGHRCPRTVGSTIVQSATAATMLVVTVLSGCGGSSAASDVSKDKNDHSLRTAGDKSSTLTTQDVIKALNVGGFRCEPQGKPYEVLYSYRSQDCQHSQKDSVTASVFSSEGEATLFFTYYPKRHPDRAIVAGRLWSVSGPPALINDVSKAMSGTKLADQ